SLDVSRLGNNYGITLSPSSPLYCLDVGPTSTGNVDGRPLTDGKLNFFDLILYAVNYSLVSMPANAPPAAAAGDALRLRLPPLPAAGQTFDVTLELSGAGDAQGVSTQLGFDPAIVEPVGVAAGTLLAQQGRESVVLSSGPGDVDVVLLGAGGGL